MTNKKCVFASFAKEKHRAHRLCFKIAKIELRELSWVTQWNLTQSEQHCNYTHLFVVNNVTLSQLYSPLALDEIIPHLVYFRYILASVYKELCSEVMPGNLYGWLHLDGHSGSIPLKKNSVTRLFHPRVLLWIEENNIHWTDTGCMFLTGKVLYWKQLLHISA